MAKVFNYITINYEKDIYTPSIDMMQGDTGRGLIFNIASPIDGLESELSNLTATLNVVKPTGETQTVTGTIESLGNDMAKVTVEPSSSLARAINVSGLANATLVIANTTQTVTSFNFKIKIKPNPFYPKPTLRKFDVTKVSRITGVQQYEHCVQSIEFVGLEYTGNMYIVLNNDTFVQDSETEGYHNTVPLTGNTFIIGQPMTFYSGVFSCQLLGETTSNGETTKFEISPIFYIEVAESIEQGEETEYPIDPNLVNGIDQYITTKESEIDSYIEQVIESIPSDYTELSNKVSAVTETEVISTVFADKQSGTETLPTGFSSTTGYLRDMRISNIGNLVSTTNVNNNTFWILAEQDMEVYAVIRNGSQQHIGLFENQPYGSANRVSPIYSSADANYPMPTADNPLSVRSGQYITFSFYNGQPLESCSWTLYSVESGEVKLASSQGLTSTMKEEVDDEIELYEGYDTSQTIINQLHHLVNYDYDEVKEVERVPTATDALAVGYKRYGQVIEIDYPEANDAIQRIRLNGTVVRTVSNTTVSSWTDGIELINGHNYKVSRILLDGTETGYGITVSVYRAGETSTVGTYEQVGNAYNRYFTAESDTTYNIVLYISNTSTSEAKYLVLLEDLSLADSDMDYYAEELADTVNKVRAECTEPSLVFTWSTDNHRYSSNADGVQNFSAMIKNMSGFVKEVPCDFNLCTGDLTDGASIQSTTLEKVHESMTDFRSIGIPFVWAMGNHDTNYAYRSGGTSPYLFTMQEVYQAYFSSTKDMVYNTSENGTDYYIDFANLNTRVISLNANNCTSHVEYAYGESTASWLDTALDTQMNVILFVHQSPYTNQVYSNRSTTGADAIRTVLNEFVSNGGNIIMLGGHSHFDGAWIEPFVSIVQDCQRFNNIADDVTDDAHDTTGYIDVIRKNARAQGTETEDLWSACVYKPDSNDLSLIRFGAGKDRYFHITPISPTTLVTKLMGTVTWSSSDSSIATVSNGVVTGLSTGKCAILANDDVGNYECWIVSID